MTRTRVCASLIAAALVGAAAAGCATTPPARPAPGAALLIVDTETIVELLHGTDVPVHTYAPAFIFVRDAAQGGSGERLHARIDGHRDVPWTTLAPGRYLVVSEVRGTRRAVEVDLAADERRVVTFKEIAEGRPFDG